MYWQNTGRSAKSKSSNINPLMFFNSAFFCKLAVLKKHSLRLVFLELFVLRKPALRQYFFRCGKIRSAPLATPNRGFCHIGSADYIRRCCSSLRELRTSVNLLNPKNESKLPSRDFANPPNR